MFVGHALWQRECQPTIPYRSIGKTLDSIGRQIVFMRASDFETHDDKSVTAKMGRALRNFISLPGAALRKIASLDQPYYVVESSPESLLLHTKKITILSLNAACLPSFITTNFNHLRSTEVRAQEIADYIYDNSDKFDLICLQEVFSEAAFQIIYAKLKEKYPSCIHHVGNSYVGFNSGLVVFSKAPITGADFKKYSSLIGEDAMTNKGVLSADISIGEKKLQLFVTHAQGGGYPQWLKKKWLVGPVSEVRKKQFTPFEKTLKEAEKKSDIVVVTGDFNFDVTNSEARKMHGGKFFEHLRDYTPSMPKGKSGSAYTKKYLVDHLAKKQLTAEKSEIDPTNQKVIDLAVLTKSSKATMKAEIIDSFTNSSDHLSSQEVTNQTAKIADFSPEA